MSKRPFDLPGLTQLASFEAAARLLSFKDAAEELNVTPSAISHQIRILEDGLATSLFDRSRRKVTLTEAGQMLYRDIHSAFQKMNAISAQIRQQGAQNTVTIAATTAVSSLWLSPRIARFLEHEDYSEYRVNQVLDDHPSLNRANQQFHIYYGKPELENQTAHELFRDKLVPVASPSFAKRYNNLELASLARLPLIELVSDEEGWTRWLEWFQALGYQGELKYSQRVNNYLIALQAARDGAGVVLGWEHLVKPMLDRGELVVLTDLACYAGDPFYLVSWSDDRLNEPAIQFREWLLNSDHLNMNIF